MDNNQEDEDSQEEGYAFEANTVDTQEIAPHLCSVISLSHALVNDEGHRTPCGPTPGNRLATPLRDRYGAGVVALPRPPAWEN